MLKIHGLETHIAELEGYCQAAIDTAANQKMKRDELERTNAELLDICSTVVTYLPQVPTDTLHDYYYNAIQTIIKEANSAIAKHHAGGFPKSS